MPTGVGTDGELALRHAVSEAVQSLRSALSGLPPEKAKSQLCGLMEEVGQLKKAADPKDVTSFRKALDETVARRSKQALEDRVGSSSEQQAPPQKTPVAVQPQPHCRSSCRRDRGTSARR